MILSVRFFSEVSYHGFKLNAPGRCFYSLIISNRENAIFCMWIISLLLLHHELTLLYVNIIGKHFRISYSGELKRYLNITQFEILMNESVNTDAGKLEASFN